MTQILLDISRLFARAQLAAPTGIDRVERQYLRWAEARGDAAFLVRVPGKDVIANAEQVREALATRSNSLIGRLGGMNPAQARLVRLARQPVNLKPGFTYFNVGHANLKPRVLALLTNLGMARFVAMIHDTIPLDAPHFCRGDQTAPAEARLRLVAMRADLVLTVSHHSAQRFAHHAHRFGRAPQAVVTPPGVGKPARHRPAKEPYFVAIGTIEPRKNTSLLLDLWENMVENDQSPTLHIVGRRGWETPAVLARLDRLKGTKVVEHNNMPDEELGALMRGARALLFPSQEEGFGIPLYEARAMGLPVIAGDLPVLREHGTANTSYLPSRDHAAWQNAIATACRADKPGQPADVPSWQAHFQIVEQALAANEPMLDVVAS